MLLEVCIHLSMWCKVLDNSWACVFDQSREWDATLSKRIEGILSFVHPSPWIKTRPDTEVEMYQLNKEKTLLVFFHSKSTVRRCKSNHPQNEVLCGLLFTFLTLATGNNLESQQSANQKWYFHSPEPLKRHVLFCFFSINEVLFFFTKCSQAFHLTTKVPISIYTLLPHFQQRSNDKGEERGGQVLFHIDVSWQKPAFTAW